jgi:LacI family transcriptional regulator
MVFVDRPPGFIDADHAVSDNAGGAEAAVEHLLAQGHRRIGYLGDQPQIFTAAERLRGYRAALERREVEQDVALVRHPRFRGEGAYESTLELLRADRPPTALFTSQNLITVGALRAVHELGLERDVAVVGFDDVMLADVLGITVVAQDPRRLGREGAELLFSRLDGYRGPSRHIVVPTTLIARGSGELPPPPA